MKFKLIFFLFAIVVSSCNSDTESKGIDNVLDFYGGRAVYSKGVNTSTNKEDTQGRFYEIKLSENEIFKNYDDVNLPVSNIAYLFYKELTPEEKLKYDFIRIVVEDKTQSFKNEYFAEDLEMVIKSMYKMDSVIDLTKNKKYHKVLDLFNPVVKDISLDMITDIFTQVDKKYGSPEKFTFLGFTLESQQIDGITTKLLKLSGIIGRDIQSTDFNIVVARDETPKYLYGFSFSM